MKLEMEISRQLIQYAKTNENQKGSKKYKKKIITKARREVKTRGMEVN